MNEEWLTWRRHGVGASEVAAIVGVEGPGRRTPFDVWRAKTDPSYVDTAESERMRWGVLLEPVIAKAFHDETGLHVAGEQMWCHHPDHEHHRATVDGFVVESASTALDDALGVFEAKTGQARWDDVPDAYTIQVQWQMHVTGMAQAWVAYLRAGYDFSVHEVERDDVLIGQLVKLVDEFWYRHVVELVPPDPRSLADVRTLWPASTARVVQLDADATAIWLRACELDRQIKRDTRELEGLKTDLGAAMGDADTAMVTDLVAATFKSHITRRWDTKALEAAHPELADDFKAETTVRTFLLKGP